MIIVNLMTPRMLNSGSTIDSMRRMAHFAIRFFPALLVVIFLFDATSSSAQFLGDVARQQRERLQNKDAHSTHVFTNEDLARPRILKGLGLQSSETPAPFASTPATPASAPAPSSEPLAKEMPAPVWPEGTPLGDVARFYRRLKELRSIPFENPVLAQDTPHDNTSGQQSNVPRRNVRTLSPDQPSQKPKKIIPVAEPSIRENSPAPRIVRVSPGDSLWKIASRYLGDGNQWQEIASVNPEISDPNLIRVGQQICLPGESATEAAATIQVRVQAGDSLWKLAKAQWGMGQAWSCIAESNPQIQDSSRIYPGQTLALPASCSLAI